MRVAENTPPAIVSVVALDLEPESREREHLVVGEHPPRRVGHAEFDALFAAIGAATWSTPAAVIDASGGLQHHLPAIASTGAELVLAWDPYAAAAAAPWQDTSSGAHVSLIRSTTGASWQGARDVTTAQAGAVTLFPTLYADHAGAYHLAWLAADASGQQVVEVPLADLAATPAPLPIDGYSPPGRHAHARRLPRRLGRRRARRARYLRARVPLIARAGTRRSRARQRRPLGSSMAGRGDKVREGAVTMVRPRTRLSTRHGCGSTRWCAANSCQ